jgi:hypothetical protein
VYVSPCTLRAEMVAQCQAACQAHAPSGCNVWTWHDQNQGQYAYNCFFRTDGESMNCLVVVEVAQLLVSVVRAAVFRYCVANSHACPRHPPALTGQWNLVAQSGHTSGRLAGGQNVYVADLSSWVPAGANVYGLRENGNRMIRARYPNANPEFGFGSTLHAVSWVPSVLPKNPDIEVRVTHGNASTRGSSACGIHLLRSGSLSVLWSLWSPSTAR